MKLKEGFITYETGTEAMLVPAGSTGFSGLVKGNKTLGIILDLLKEETTEAAMIGALQDRFDAPEDVIVRDVRNVRTELRGIGALDD